MGSSIYGVYARALYKSREDIRRLENRFTVFDSVGEPPDIEESVGWEPWLTHVQAQDSVRNTAIAHHRALGNETNAVRFEKARDGEVKQYNAAVDDLRQKQPVLRQLENSGEVFRAIDSATNEFRYIVDEEAQKYFCMEREGSLDDEEFGQRCESHFFGPKRIELTGNQTDAVRIQCNNVVLRDIEVTDKRSYGDIAHRDGIQLIPPNLQHGDRVLADRMAGSVIHNVIVDNCTIDAPEAKLQGIFSSDGFCQNVIITNNRIKTAATHFISIAGVLDGCRISNNILQQSSDSPPQIKLFPGRLGGNMADDGVVYVLSFSADGSYHYQDVTSFANQYISADQQLLPDQFSDERNRIPQGYGRVALGLKNFNYDRYMATYSQWTVAVYKKEDPVGFRRLRSWLEQRIKEYETGVRTELDRENYAILPRPTYEQRTRVLNKLRPALALLNNSDYEFLNTRIADLQSMPIRSFIIKRLAVRQGDITLAGLGSDDLARRTAQLKWFLDDSLPMDGVEEDAATPAVAPQPLPKNYGELKIMASPLSAKQGELITFSVEESAYAQPDDQVSYFWITGGKTSGSQQFELDTSELPQGEHRVRATMYVRSADGALERQVPGSAVFMVKAPAALSADYAEFERPVRAFGSLKDYLRVSRARIAGGQKLSVSLDPAFIEEQEKDGNVRYFWAASGQSIGKGESYEIDTTELNPGEHLVRVTMHRVDQLTNKYKQFTGLAVVEVLGVSEPV